MTIWLDCFADNPVTGTVVQASDQSPIAGANVLLKNVEGKSPLCRPRQVKILPFMSPKWDTVPIQLLWCLMVNLS